MTQFDTLVAEEAAASRHQCDIQCRMGVRRAELEKAALARINEQVEAEFVSEIAPARAATAFARDKLEAYRRTQERRVMVIEIDVTRMERHGARWIAPYVHYGYETDGWMTTQLAHGHTIRVESRPVAPQAETK